MKFLALVSVSNTRRKAGVSALRNPQPSRSTRDQETLCSSYHVRHNRVENPVSQSEFDEVEHGGVIASHNYVYLSVRSCSPPASTLMALPCL